MPAEATGRSPPPAEADPYPARAQAEPDGSGDRAGHVLGSRRGLQPGPELADQLIAGQPPAEHHPVSEAFQPAPDRRGDHGGDDGEHDG